MERCLHLTINNRCAKSTWLPFAEVPFVGGKSVWKCCRTTFSYLQLFSSILVVQSRRNCQDIGEHSKCESEWIVYINSMEHRCSNKCDGLSSNVWCNRTDWPTLGNKLDGTDGYYSILYMFNGVLSTCIIFAIQIYFDFLNSFGIRNKWFRLLQ